MSLFIANKYTRWYYNIIDNACQEKRSKGVGSYYERHHITPKSLGGNDKKDNLVLLTAREHFICHWLLIKMIHEYEDLVKMKHAFCIMMFGNRYTYHNRYFNSRLFEIARKFKSSCMTGKSRKVSNEERKNASKREKERFELGLNPICKFGKDNYMFGKCGAKHHRFGVPHSLEIRNKISKNHHNVSGSNNPRAIEFQFIDPKGNTYNVCGNFREFCYRYDLPFSTMYNNVLKKRKFPKTGKCVGWDVFVKD